MQHKGKTDAQRLLSDVPPSRKALQGEMHVRGAEEERRLI